MNCLICTEEVSMYFPLIEYTWWSSSLLLLLSDLSDPGALAYEPPGVTGSPRLPADDADIDLDGLATGATGWGKLLMG